jgi:pantothenate kinase-related protein Tda10
VQAKDGKEMVNLPFYDNVSNDGKDDRNSRGSSL